MSFGPAQIFGAAGALAFVGFAAVAAQGCTVLTNDEQTCPECQHQACIGQWSVCGGNAECMAIYTCATADSCDQSCVDQCYLAHPTGEAAYYALASCDAQALTSATCAPLCPAQTTTDSGADTATTPDAAIDASSASDASDDALDDGAIANDSATPDASTAVDSGSVQSCTDCTSQSCASQKAACASGTACDTYTSCLGACTDVACVSTCGTTYAEGKTASNALGDCVTTSCSGPCGLMQ